jgi:DNA-binding GntR family transcriptional regulator
VTHPLAGAPGSGTPLPGASTPFESKADYIARELRRQILEGTLAPDSELRQRDLAEAFQVSPTPVREALSRLHAEGYVATRLHGTSVVRSAVERRQENWRIRSSLESLAAELATERVQAADLNDIVGLAEAFARADDDDEARRTNLAFHFRIYQAAGSPVLLRFLEDLWRALDVAPNSYRRHDASAAQHFAIVEAIRAGDRALAARLTQQHISETADKAQQHGPEDSKRAPRESKKRAQGHG